MNTNDVLRRLRYALDIDDDGLTTLFTAGGVEPTRETLHAWLLHEGEPGAEECPALAFEGFLDALIVQRRGVANTSHAPPLWAPLNNNAILKKLRIALSLRDVDILELLDLGGQPFSKAGLGGLLRPPQHRHYRECGDQLLRAFLRGLTRKMRRSAPKQA